jgi:hypothetical protein
MSTAWNIFLVTLHTFLFSRRWTDVINDLNEKKKKGTLQAFWSRNIWKTLSSYIYGVAILCKAYLLQTTGPQISI